MEQRSTENHYALPARLVRGELRQLKKHFQEQLLNCGKLTIDATNVLEVDGTGVQLLLSLARSAMEQECALAFTNVSEALAKAFAANHALDALAQ